MTTSQSKQEGRWHQLDAGVVTVALLFALLLFEGIWIHRTRLETTRRAAYITSLRDNIENSLLRSRAAIADLLSGGDPSLARTQRDAANASLERSVDQVRRECENERQLVNASVKLRDLAMGPLNALYGRHLESGTSLIEAKAYDNLQYPALRLEAEQLFKSFSDEVDSVRQSELRRLESVESAGFPLAALTGGALLYAFWRVIRRAVGSASPLTPASAREWLREIANISREGQTEARQIAASMKALMGSHAQQAGALACIRERGARLSTISGTLSKVAEQTNLLSLNAAIEAEKAGEYGLGFAVIAMEVRRLSDQTLEAHQDIEQIVQELSGSLTGGEPDPFTRGGELVETLERRSQAIAGSFERISAAIERANPEKPIRS